MVHHQEEEEEKKEVEEEVSAAPTAMTYGGWNLPKEGDESTPEPLEPGAKAESLDAAQSAFGTGSFADMLQNAALGTPEQRDEVISDLYWHGTLV